MESITLRAGSSLRESGGEIYSPYEMIQHPEYDQNNFDYDFVLIRVLFHYYLIINILYKTHLFRSMVTFPITRTLKKLDQPLGDH